MGQDKVVEQIPQCAPSRIVKKARIFKIDDPKKSVLEEDEMFLNYWCVNDFVILLV